VHRGIFDGELVAFNDEGLPDFSTVCRRIRRGDKRIRLTYVVFDVLESDGEDTMGCGTGSAANCSNH
jgi:ATP-dependent DNA ligase